MLGADPAEAIGAAQKEPRTERAATHIKAPAQPATETAATVASRTVSERVASAIAPAKAQRNALDYSRFANIDEDEEEQAAPDPAKLKAQWDRHVRLRWMRGEEPLDLKKWQDCSARLAKSARRRGEAGPAPLLDLAGRGLWCRTNLEEAFDKMSGEEEGPREEDLGPLTTPDILSAMSGAPGARIVDATHWARTALRTELVKACATDRTEALMPGSEGGEHVRIDAIIGEVDVGEGNAAVVANEAEGHFLCAYRFKVDLSYSINIAERASPDEDPVEKRYLGDIGIPELVSGVLPDFQKTTAQMRTSLQVPKPPKKHMLALRPLLARLELSLAYFARRFEHQFLKRVALPSSAP